MKGIYECNGVYAYSMNLEKKLKRKKNAVIVETFDGDYTEDDLKEALKQYQFTKKDNNEEEVKLHHFINKVTNETLTSIYSDLHNIQNIKLEEWGNI